VKNIIGRRLVTNGIGSIKRRVKMFVIQNKLANKYYNGPDWVENIRDAMQMTGPRAMEILESLQLQVKKNMLTGEFVMIEQA
jgi:hypothetical protein